MRVCIVRVTRRLDGFGVVASIDPGLIPPKTLVQVRNLYHSDRFNTSATYGIVRKHSEHAQSATQLQQQTPEYKAFLLIWLFFG